MRGLPVASQPVQQSIKQHPGELLADVWPDFAREYHEQPDGLAAVYEENGVKVHRPRKFTQDELDSDATPAVYQCSPAARYVDRIACYRARVVSTVIEGLYVANPMNVDIHPVGGGVSRWPEGDPVGGPLDQKPGPLHYRLRNH